MRPRFLLASVPVAIGAFAACASSDEVGPEHGSTLEGGVVPPAADAASSDAATDLEAEAAAPRCSEAGWCTTALPDSDLMMKDIWPLSGRAFAIAESETLGVKVLEWKDGDAAWNYIDDNTQNQVGGKYAGAIWAPDDDTLYYAVAPSYIYRGTRLSPPEAGWSWSSQKLEDNSHAGEPAHAVHDHGHPRNYMLRQDYPALGVWGIDANDVYAWYSNTVFHWEADDGGVATWVAKYVANDTELTSDHLFFVSAAGSGTDDVWFAGVRERGVRSCALLVRKTPAGFARVADGVNAAEGCTPRTGLPHIGGAEGWLTAISSTGPGRILGLKGGSDIVSVAADDDVLTVGVESVPLFAATMGTSPNWYRSFWRSPSGVSWLTAWTLVIRGEGSGDAATYGISTLSLHGAPIPSPMHQVRGTSDTNVWTTGNGYALHKTTP